MSNINKFDSMSNEKIRPTPSELFNDMVDKCIKKSDYRDRRRCIEDTIRSISDYDDSNDLFKFNNMFHQPYMLSKLKQVCHVTNVRGMNGILKEGGLTPRKECTSNECRVSNYSGSLESKDDRIYVMAAGNIQQYSKCRPLAKPFFSDPIDEDKSIDEDTILENYPVTLLLELSPQLIANHGIMDEDAEILFKYDRGIKRLYRVGLLPKSKIVDYFIEKGIRHRTDADSLAEYVIDAKENGLWTLSNLENGLKLAPDWLRSWWMTSTYALNSKISIDAIRGVELPLPALEKLSGQMPTINIRDEFKKIRLNSKGFMKNNFGY